MSDCDVSGGEYEYLEWLFALGVYFAGFASYTDYVVFFRTSASECIAHAEQRIENVRCHCAEHLTSSARMPAWSYVSYVGNCTAVTSVAVRFPTHLPYTYPYYIMLLGSSSNVQRIFENILVIII